MTRPARGAAALCFVLIAACGTTLPTPSASTDQPGAATGSIAGGTTQTQAGSTTGLPNGSTGDANDSTTGSTPGATDVTTGGTPADGSTSGTSGDVTGGSTGVPTTPAPGSGLAIPTSGRGWDSKTVYLGLMTAADAEKALGAAGIQLDPGDTAGDAHAVQDAINRRGGLYGRKVQVVVHDNASASIQANASSAAAANCAYFTQDRPVLAVINTVSVLDLGTLRSCLAQKKTPLFTLSTQPFDNQLQDSTAPYYYNGVSVSWTPLIPLMVKRLQAQQYLTPWNNRSGAASSTGKPKVGILYGSDEPGARIGPKLAAQFKAAGYDTDTFQWAQTSDAGAAVLRFEQNNVTHVVSIDNFLFFFATAAGSQAFYPRLAVNTYNGIQALLEAQTPKRQLAGAKGIGWYPPLDVDRDTGNAVGRGTAQCLKDLAAGGQTFSGKRFAEAVGRALCDGIGLAVAGAKAGGGLDAASVRRGVVQLGSSFATSGSTGSGLSSTQFGVPGELRDMSFDASCSCFAYTSSGYRL